MKKIITKKFFCCILSIITMFSLSIKINATEKKSDTIDSSITGKINSNKTINDIKLNKRLNKTLNKINLNDLKPGKEKFLSNDKNGTFYIKLTDENEKSNSFIKSDTINSNITDSINSNKTINDIKLNKALNKINLNDLKLNEKRALSSDENGTFYITLVNENKMTIRGTNMSRTQAFTITYEEPVLGVTLNAFRVTLTCECFSDGLNSIIYSLKGTYTILSNEFSCSWDKNNTIANATYHAIGLDVYRRGGQSAYYIFTAIIDAKGDANLSVYV